MRAVCHPCIVAYFDSFFDSKQTLLHIVMEYADGGSLNKVIKKHTLIQQYISEPVRDYMVIYDYGVDDIAIFGADLHGDSALPLKGTSVVCCICIIVVEGMIISLSSPCICRYYIEISRQITYFL